MHGSHEIFCGILRASECPYGQRVGHVEQTVAQESDNHALSCKFQLTGSTHLHVGG